MPKLIEIWAWRSKPKDNTEPCVQLSSFGHAWKRAWVSQGTGWRGALCLNASKKGIKMFWTIVGAILFVFIGIPIILTLLGLGIWLLFVVGKLVIGKSSEIAHSNSLPKRIIKYLYQHKLIVILLGIILVAGFVIVVNTIDQTIPLPTVTNYNYSGYQSSYEAEQEMRRQSLIAEQARKQELIKKQYEDAIAKVKSDNPDKKLSWDDESYIRANIPTTLNYFTLKDMLLERGFEFIGYQSKIYNSNQ